MSYSVEPCVICGIPAVMGLCEGKCAQEWLQKHDHPRIERKCTYCRSVTAWNRTYKAFVHDECVIKEKNRVANMKHPSGPPLNRRERRERERAESKRRTALGGIVKPEPS